MGEPSLSQVESARSRALAVLLELLDRSETLLKVVALGPDDARKQAIATVTDSTRRAEDDIHAFEQSHLLDSPLSVSDVAGVARARETVCRLHATLNKLKERPAVASTPAPIAPASADPLQERLRLLRGSMLEALDGAERLIELSALAPIAKRAAIVGEAMRMMGLAQSFVVECMRLDSKERPVTDEERRDVALFASRMDRLKIRMAEMNPSRGQA